MVSIFTRKDGGGPLVLLVLDGVGSFRPYRGNAVAYGNTPTLEKLWTQYPTALLHASSRYVGLPEGIKGNSEVGHMNLAAGRIVLQDLPRINQSIKQKTFFKNQVLTQIAEYIYKTKAGIHFIGCLSDGEVHSTIEHLKALLLFFKVHGLGEADMFIHAFTDGRDAPPKAAFTYFYKIDLFKREYDIKGARFSTIIGRRFAMDRNRQWDYTKMAYDLLTQFKGTRVPDWGKALELAYRKVESDEFIPPFVIDNEDNRPIQKGDVVISYNYRADRMVQLMMAFVDPDFSHFHRVHQPGDFKVYSLTYYGKHFTQKVTHIFPKIMVGDNIGKIISDNGLKQVRIAESVKFPHVTYFFNGGMNIVYPNEDRIKIPTNHLMSFDEDPKMQVYKVTEALINNLLQRKYNFYMVNFANGDMVGHTGNLEAAKQAMAHMDRCINVIVQAVLKLNGTLIITADHGNVEEMLDPVTGQVDTEHSIYPVPFIAINRGFRFRPPIMGKLSDVSLTVLHLLGLEIPGTYDGKVLV